MPPRLATLICVLLIGFLFWIDRKRGEGVSNAVWIPFLWMFFAGSRYASQWLDLSPGLSMSADAYNEGSPLDRDVFLVLLLSGVWVLSRRGLNWRDLILKNAWVWLFFLFAVMSIFWSDEPFIALKRWVKGFGNLIMALIILSERRPQDALGWALTRLGFVLVPISVLFVRYYPDLGRTFHMGLPMLTGAAFSKNSLGQFCLIVAIYLIWEITMNRTQANAIAKRPSLLPHVIVLPLTAWLLYVSDSATCLALMALAIAYLSIARLSVVARKPRRIVTIGLAVLVLAVLLESAFGIKDAFIRMLGREPDLTSRTPIWRILVELAPHPLIGAGYESFWSGDRLFDVWARLGFGREGGIIQAHNGYIETYLNLGIVGLVLLTMSIVAGSIKAIRQLDAKYAYAALRLLIIVIVVIYNYTEAAYKPLNNMFVLLLFAIVQLPGIAAKNTAGRSHLSPRQVRLAASHNGARTRHGTVNKHDIRSEGSRAPSSRERHTK